MFANVSTPELCYALGLLVRCDEPNGIPLDEHERERLAVAFVREVMSREDMQPARDLATEQEGNRVRVYVGNRPLHSRAVRLSFGAEIVAGEQERNRHPDREPYTFLRGRRFVVGGKYLRLTWAV